MSLTNNLSDNIPEVTEEEYEKTMKLFDDDRVFLLKNSMFHGLVLLNFDFIPVNAKVVRTACIDLKAIRVQAVDPQRYPPDKRPPLCYWQMSQGERELLLKHELNHAILQHLQATKNLKRRVANVAMDAVIHRMMYRDPSTPMSILEAAVPGIVRPIEHGAQYAGFRVGVPPNQKEFRIDDFDNKDWLPIYHDILDMMEKNPALEDMFNPQDGDVEWIEDEMDAETEQRIQDIKESVCSAYERCRDHGDMPAEISRLVNKLTQGEVDWVAELRNLVRTEVTKDDYSWKFNARRAHIIPYPPKLESEAVKAIWCVMDTSGSMGREMITKGISEFKSLRQAISFDFYFVACDAKAYEVKEYSKYDEVDWDSLPIKGGGGTDFRPAFETINKWREQTGESPALIVFFTDTYGTFPKEVPDYDVVWVVPHKYAERVPFGRIISVGEN